MRTPPFLDFIYPGFQNIINRTLIGLGYNPAIKHQKVLVKHIKKQICKRLQEKEKYGDSWKRPDDFLQDIMEEGGFDPDNVNYPLIADLMCMFIFASIHTTSRACTDSVINLASRPEYMQELYEEQLEVHKEAAVLKDYTFSNGLQVPKDSEVDHYFDDVYRDESLQGSNPKSFEPFRHLNTKASA